MSKKKNILGENQLDEMQENTLLNIEKGGCWLAFWGLLIVYLVEFAIGMDFKCYLGEVIVMLALSSYIGIQCMRKGIWDRHLKPNTKTNFICAFVASTVLAAIFGANTYRYRNIVMDGLVTAAVMFVFSFILIFGALTLSVHIYKKRIKKFEDILDEKK